jgi:predicted nucleic acid-binding protein
MRFWDSSALLPLVVEEERSVACRALHRADRVMVVWVLTRTEVTSGIRRLARETKLGKAEVPLVLRRIERLAKSWTEVDAVGLVRDRAERLLGAHTLTAVDALQLGAALVLVRDRPKGKVFVCADDRLILAAEAEGFDVVVPSG